MKIQQEKIFKSCRSKVLNEKDKARKRKWYIKFIFTKDQRNKLMTQKLMKTIMIYKTTKYKKLQHL